MKRGYWSILIGIILFACQKGDVEKDKQAIESLIESDTVWFNTTTEVESTSTQATLITQAGDTVSIIWWRGPQTHSPAVVNIEVVGDSAYVEWSRGNMGNLNIWAYTPSDSQWHFWQKPVVETAKLNAIFYRTGSLTDPNRGWVLKKLSCAWAQSDTLHQVVIDSIRIESASNPNLLIKDPLNTFYDLDSLITFTSGESVDITLYSHGEEANAFLHTFILIPPYYVRDHFVNQGNGIHKGRWRAQLIPFPRYAIFDLLNHNSLYTEEGRYDFNGWLIPYTIKGK